MLHKGLRGLRAKSPYRERPSRLGKARADCDLTKALSLAGALEDEAILHKREQRK